MYFDNNEGGDQPYQNPSNQILYLDFDSTQPIEQELMMQCQIEAQLLSPPQRRRQDSLFSWSPSNVSKTNVPSLYQADTQPCVSVTHMMPYGYSQRPVKMARTESQYSATSSQPQRRSQQRSSFGYDTRSSAINMSRSSTQYSAGSSGYTQQQHLSPPRPRQSQPHLDLTDCTLTNSGYHEAATSEQDTQCKHNATTLLDQMDSWYNIGLQDVQALGAVGSDDNDMAYSSIHVSSKGKQRAQACASNG
jgi:hypothetical protein